MRNFVAGGLTMCVILFLAQCVFGAECVATDVPDPRCSPGMRQADITAERACSTTWGEDHRHVTPKMKKQVFRYYGIPWSEHMNYEVDHVISRELGGADALPNLWPQRWVGTWNAHMKDRLENRLHRELCSGAITLDQAQNMINGDWRVAYVQYFGGL